MPKLSVTAGHTASAGQTLSVCLPQHLPGAQPDACETAWYHVPSAEHFKSIRHNVHTQINSTVASLLLST